MKRCIPHSLPFVGKEELGALARVIARKQLSQSTEAALLEKELAGIAGHRYGASVSSGTAALYLALRALGITKKDSVIIPSYACTALLNAVNFLGAKPLLADVDSRTGNCTSLTVKNALRKNTAAVIVPHLFGYPADVTGISRLGVPVIEDCAQCIGARIRGREVGGLSQVSIFSMYATKLIGAGEGGMIASSDKSIIDGVTALREYDNREAYVQGFNFKISDLQASVARAQVKKLPVMIEKRRMLAGRYREVAAPFDHLFKLPLQEPGIEPVYFRFVVRCASAELRDVLIKKMDALGIGCRKPVFMPLHHYLGLKGFPGTDALYEQALSLPLYPGLDKKDVDYIVRQIGKIAEVK